MKRHPSFITAVLGCLSIYPLLIFILLFTGLSCYLASAYLPRISIFADEAAPIRVKQLRPLPTVASEDLLTSETSGLIAEPNQPRSRFPDQTLLPDDAPRPVIEPTFEVAEANTALPGESYASVETVDQTNQIPPTTFESPVIVAALPTATPTIDLVFEFPYSVDDLHRRTRATPTPQSILGGVVSSLAEVFNDADETETISRRSKLPTFTATPTGTSTPTPTDTATVTSTPTATPLPTDTPPPTATPTFTMTPPPTNTPIPPPPTAVPLPTETPLPTATPLPEYDFLVGEFYNSPTTNPFLVMYVAIVDTNEIPIGDMKVVGTRLDHNLTYESPLSTWHFEGYNAPGEVIKSGNVKFEPPGGIEDVDWLIYLADANGARLSDDVPFHTDPNSKQWYFVKFRRKF